MPESAICRGGYGLCHGGGLIKDVTTAEPTGTRTRLPPHFRLFVSLRPIYKQQHKAIPEQDGGHTQYGDCQRQPSQHPAHAQPTETGRGSPGGRTGNNSGRSHRHFLLPRNGRALKPQQAYRPYLPMWRGKLLVRIMLKADRSRG